MNAISARVALLDHLNAQKDSAGVSLADTAFAAADYEQGETSEEARNWKRAYQDAIRPRGIVGPHFSVTWANGCLSHTVKETET